MQQKIFVKLLFITVIYIQKVTIILTLMQMRPTIKSWFNWYLSTLSDGWQKKYFYWHYYIKIIPCSLKQIVYVKIRVSSPCDAM